jgi:hypothetical protein
MTKLGKRLIRAAKEGVAIARGEGEPTAWSGPGRDMVAKPYSPDEERVAAYLVEKTGIGAGDDPIGFLIASHETLAYQLRLAVAHGDEETIAAERALAVHLAKGIADGTVETKPFDTADYLNDEEDIAEYLKAVAEDDDPETTASAQEDVARARARIAGR